MGSLGTLPDPLDINDRTDTTITAADEIVYADATDSAAIKKDTVQGILDLVPAVADNAITLAKMASGTDGNIISYDASGDPVAIATGSDGMVLTSAGAGAQPAFEALPSSGKVLQVVNTQTGAFASGTTVMPDDSATPPQISEGNEFMTLAITPANSSNKLLIQVILYGCNSSGGQVVNCALFQDSTANALAVDGKYQTQTNEKLSNYVITYYMAAGTTSATTFKVRAGSGSGTMLFNGSSGANLDHGGAIKSGITIWEIAA